MKPLAISAIAQLFASQAMAFNPSSGAARFVGFDLGTSGARISIVEGDADADADADAARQPSYREIYSDGIAWSRDAPYDNAGAWMAAVFELLERAQGTGYLSSVRSICASGTSASCCVIDSKNCGSVTRRPRMYDFDVTSSAENLAASVRAMDLIDKHAPPRHTARAATGSLAKLLSWNEEQPLKSGEVLCHQADYVAMNLMSDAKKCGSGGGAMKRIVRSDWHNTLKCGYDVRNLHWPDWIVACLQEGGISDPLGTGVLPTEVVSPGQPLGTVSEVIAERYGIPKNAVVVGGTTDSNAAFLAAAGAKPELGTAVTSLGSTLAIKQLSETYVEDADRGVYSHRFPVFRSSDGKESDGGGSEAWLIGGASNVGCAVLRQEKFSNEELVELSKDIDPASNSPLKYYPLTKKGERFPAANSDMLPMLDPKPDTRVEYLHGILQGISDVEREGFKVLGDLGASPGMPRNVLSCGGGARNEMWIEMRQRKMRELDGAESVAVRRADNTEASYGAALLAASNIRS